MSTLRAVERGRDVPVGSPVRCSIKRRRSVTQKDLPARQFLPTRRRRDQLWQLLKCAPRSLSVDEAWHYEFQGRRAAVDRRAFNADRDAVRGCAQQKVLNMIVIEDDMLQAGQRTDQRFVHWNQRHLS